MTRADRPIPCFSALIGLLVASLMLGAITAPAHAQLILERDQVRELQGVELEEQLGAYIPLDATFVDDTGETVRLASYFGDRKPVILALVYYECPVVCTIVLDKLLDSLNRLDYTVGKDYRLLVVSFDHRETTTHARGQKIRFLRHYNRASEPGVGQGVMYHTGDEVDIRRLTDAVGFQFAPLRNGEWSHPAGLVILSPEGKVTRYLYGYDYPPDQLMLSLLDATNGRIARSIGERIMHFCFRYDPTAGAYSLQAMALMRLAGAATVVILTVIIVVLFIGERVRQRVLARSSSGIQSGDDRGSSRAGRSPVSPAGQVS